MDKFIIKRSEWLRGGIPSTQLLNREGEKCCLGFFSLACGIDSKYIQGVATPADICRIFFTTPKLNDKFPEWVLASSHNATINSSDINSLMCINDDKDINDSKREENIKEIFAKHNITVEFED